MLAEVIQAEPAATQATIQLTWQVVVGYHFCITAIMIALILQLKDKAERLRGTRNEVERLTVNSMNNGWLRGFDMFLNFYDKMQEHSDKRPPNDHQKDPHGDTPNNVD